jgi:hypothetical protein
MYHLEARKNRIWAEYSIVNKEYFDFLLQFVDYFSDRWCDNFYNYIVLNDHTSKYKFTKFIKRLDIILKSKKH